jgi:general secretion pathway protein K
MRDAQASINLQGLASGDQVDEQRLATLQRLLEVLNLDRDLAKSIAKRFAASPKPASFDELARALVGDGTLDAVAVDRLRPFVSILPTPTPVNLNTAPAEVLAAVFPKLPLDAARALVRSREQAWFTQVGDVEARMPGAGGDGAATNVAVTSGYFSLEGRVRVGRADLAVAALIEREQNGATRVRSLTEQ